MEKMKKNWQFQDMKSETAYHPDASIYLLMGPLLQAEISQLQGNIARGQIHFLKDYLQLLL